MKKLFALLLSAVLLLDLAACGAKTPGPEATKTVTEPPKTTTEKWRLSAFSTFSEENPVDQDGTDDQLQAGKTPRGKAVFAFIRMDLGSEFFASELTDAQLFLKPAGEAVPSQLRLRLVTGGRDGYFNSARRGGNAA
ncbi:MAG: hypothetical protein LBJ11_11840 [Oscillospiraceae bacterium]|jgi:predicted small lipoprotein YifL|nr:hypothetical protein [Oscillospiraceae bacterium]